MAKPIPYRIVDMSVEWTYERAEGDIVVFAVDALQALAFIRSHGFIITDPTRLKQTGVLTTRKREPIT